MNLEEIKPPHFQEYMSPTGKSCPSCGGSLGWGQVMCPDGQSGCCAVHYGYICAKCNKQFKNVDDYRTFHMIK